MGGMERILLWVSENLADGETADGRTRRAPKIFDGADSPDGRQAHARAL